MMANNLISNGILGLGGFGVGGDNMPTNSLLGQYYDPAEMRKYQMKQMLLGMGAGLMAENDVGKGLALGLAAGDRAGQAYRENAMDAARLGMVQQDRARQEAEDQAAAEAEAQQQAAVEAMLSNVPPEQRAFAQAYPDVYARQYAQTMFPDAPQATDDMREFQYAQSNPQFADWMNHGSRSQAPKVQTITQPDGSQVAVQWDQQSNSWVPLQAPQGANPVRPMPKLTEQQSKDLVYLQRGEAALSNLENGGSALAGFADNAYDSLPLVGNYLTSEDYQMANQAGREFLAAILRKDTGAAITAQEMSVYGKMYLPQPGDGPDVLAQKADARKLALEAIRTGLGAAARALPAQAGNTFPQPTQAPAAPQAPAVRRYNPATGRIE